MILTHFGINNQTLLMVVQLDLQELEPMAQEKTSLFFTMRGMMRLYCQKR
jgi:hypothetical protein